MSRNTSATPSLEFLHPDNVAGRTLLSLVARGSAILAELLRLSDHIPHVFLDPTTKYAPVLFDFRYLKAPELFDAKIDNDTDLTDLDEEFRENNFQLLERFYSLFESIYRYYADFLLYLRELEEAVFVQYTIENVLEDMDGGQLLCECLYQYGVMLLLMDRRIPGEIRERMIISYYRYKGSGSVNHMEEVVRIARATGYSKAAKRPPNYPEDLFARIPFREDIAMLFVSRLRADDLYNNTSVFPAPVHRSLAYSTQAALLYIILFFVPDVLHKKENVMREIVDKHFPDNWVIAYYMGSTIDLVDAWAPYKAASTALKNVLSKPNVETEAKKHAQAVATLNEQLGKLLTEGVMTDEFVLQNPRQLVQQARECNCTLRWLLLHRTTTNKKIAEYISSLVPIKDLLRLTMHTAQFEFVLKEIVKRLLDAKQERWDKCKKETVDRLLELSSYYSGEKELTRVKRNQHLQDWFKQLAEEIRNLEFTSSISVGRKLTSINNALEEVQQFHQIDTSLQVKQFLNDCREYTQKMMQTISITYKLQGDLDIISDFSYAWDLIQEYVPLMHERLRRNPHSCLLLRATFLKLASILSVPMVRIAQANSDDGVSVANYFSTQLVLFVRLVLEVIPRSVFKVLDEIIALLSNQLKELPTKLERKYIKDFAQLPERFNLARLTHQVSVFAQGIIAMNTTLIGIIPLDPRQLLEDGIRKELVRQVAAVMHEYLTFRMTKVDDFELRLTELGRKLDGFRQSFEYIQDYVGMYGLKIWQEEISRIINYNVEQECNSFLRKKVYDWQSEYQSDAIPIPTFPPVVSPLVKNAPVSVNFMGRLARELLLQTDVKSTVYVESLQGWYDATNREVVGIRTFSLLHRGVGIFGLTGVDKLICFMIVKEVQDFVRLYRQVISKPVQQFLQQINAEVTPLTKLVASGGDKLFQAALAKTSKLWPQFLESVTKIGQAQLVRRQIANELNFTAKLDSKLLSASLETMNAALINDVQQHYARPDDKPYPGNPTLPDVSAYLESAGINDPLTKIYITTESVDHFPLVMFFFVLSQLPLLTWNPVRATLENKNKNLALDGAPLLVGVITILQQFHSVHLHSFLGYMGQYVRSHVNVALQGQSSASLSSLSSSSSSSSSKGVPTLPGEIVNVLLFLEELCKFSKISRSAIESVLPRYILDRYPRPLAVQ